MGLAALVGRVDLQKRQSLSEAAALDTCWVPHSFRFVMPCLSLMLWYLFNRHTLSLTRRFFPSDTKCQGGLWMAAAHTRGARQTSPGRERKKLKFPAPLAPHAQGGRGMLFLRRYLENSWERPRNLRVINEKWPNSIAQLEMTQIRGSLTSLRGNLGALPNIW